MKKILLMALAGVLFTACGESSTVSKKPVDQANASDMARKETVVAHSTDKDKESKNLPAPPNSENSDSKTKWTRSGDPIDTTNFDDEISKAEKAFKAAPEDSSKKTILAEAYFKRGSALTEARQYASAIGDYRRALEYVPDHAESKKWIGMITSIYQSMNREIPPPGEEPAPLEFKKEKSG